jgi:phosphoglycolate phosphatase
VARLAGIRLVVFDLDGTLIDSAPDLASAVNAMLARLHPAAAPLSEAQVRSFVGDGARTLMERSLAARATSLAVEDALAVFLDEYRARMLQRTRLYPGAREVLDALAGTRTLAVLSNKLGDMSRTILAGLGVADRFARICGGDEVPKKPDPAGLRQLVTELGATPSQTAMIGDSANDVRTGRAAGARTVGVTYGYDGAGMLGQQPDAVLDELGQLPALLDAPA